MSRALQVRRPSFLLRSMSAGLQSAHANFQTLCVVVQDGRILGCTACQENQSIATATSNGSVNVWRVEYTSKTGGMPERYTGIAGDGLNQPARSLHQLCTA